MQLFLKVKKYTIIVLAAIIGYGHLALMLEQPAIAARADSEKEKFCQEVRIDEKSI